MLKLQLLRIEHIQGTSTNSIMPFQAISQAWPKIGSLTFLGSTKFGIADYLSFVDYRNTADSASELLPLRATHAMYIFQTIWISRWFCLFNIRFVRQNNNSKKHSSLLLVINALYRWRQQTCEGEPALGWRISRILIWPLIRSTHDGRWYADDQQLVKLSKWMFGAYREIL